MMSRPAQDRNDSERGQSMIEYAIVMAIVVAALLGIRQAMVAHLCGGWRATLDQFGHGHQYEPNVTTSGYDDTGDSVNTTTF